MRMRKKGRLELPTELRAHAKPQRIQPNEAGRVGLAVGAVIVFERGRYTTLMHCPNVDQILGVNHNTLKILEKIVLGHVITT